MMKTWITSLSGAATLSFIHVLLEMWRGFLDFSFVLPDYAGGSTGILALYALVYMIIFALWLVGLRSARQGSRRGMMTAIAVGALFWVGVDISTIFFYCPGGCEEVVFDITTYVAIVLGELALLAMFMNLRGASPASAAQV